MAAVEATTEPLGMEPGLRPLDQRLLLTGGLVSFLYGPGRREAAGCHSSA